MEWCKHLPSHPTQGQEAKAGELLQPEDVCACMQGEIGALPEVGRWREAVGGQRRCSHSWDSVTALDWKWVAGKFLEVQD